MVATLKVDFNIRILVVPHGSKGSMYLNGASGIIHTKVLKTMKETTGLSLPTLTD